MTSLSRIVGIAAAALLLAVPQAFAQQFRDVITNAPAATTLTGAEFIAVIQGHTTKHLTGTDFLALQNRNNVSITGGTLSGLLAVGVAPTAGLNQGLSVTQTGSGTLSSTSTCDSDLGHGLAFNCIKITGDTISSGSGVNSGLALHYSYGGNADTASCTPFPTQCSHTSLWLDLTKTATTVGVSFDTTLFVNNRVASAAPGYLAGGVTKVQSIYGLGVQVADDGGRHYGVTGGEVDVALTKNNTERKMGWEVGSVPLFYGNDAYQGTLFSAAYDAFSSGACGAGAGPGGGACAGFTYGLSFGRDDTYVPVTSTGTLIVVTAGLGTANFANGVDFTAATFTGCSFKATGFCVNSRGEVATLATFPTFIMTDLNATPTTGGKIRLAGDGAGNYSFQINTAVAADFSSVISPLGWSAAGVVSALNLDVAGAITGPSTGFKPNATATSFTVANQALFMNGTYTGSGQGPYAEISIQDTAGNPVIAPLVGLRVDHNMNAGLSAGSRTAFQAALTQNAGAPGTDGLLKFYTGIFGQAYFSHNEGGGLGTEKADVYGVAGIAQLQSGATHFNGVQGAELDVSVQTGASVAYKSVLTLASVNEDAIKGSNFDAMFAMLRDYSSTALFDYGISFGRPNLGLWPIETLTGTLIGVPAGSSAGALYGIDFTNLTIASGGAYLKGPTFSIDENGSLRSSAAVVTPALYLATIADWSTGPTIASGGCTTGSAQSIPNNNGTAKFNILLGGATCGSTITLTLPAAAVGWHCTADDITTPATSEVHQTSAPSTTSVVLTNFVRTTGVAGNFTGADTLTVSCRGG